MKPIHCAKKTLTTILTGLAIFAGVALSPAQAGTIDSVAFTYTAQSPLSPEQVFNATWQRAWDICRSWHPNTRSLRLASAGPWIRALANPNALTARIIWNCQDNP